MNNVSTPLRGTVGWYHQTPLLGRTPLTFHEIADSTRVWSNAAEVENEANVRQWREVSDGVIEGVHRMFRVIDATRQQVTSDCSQTARRGCTACCDARRRGRRHSPDHRVERRRGLLFVFHLSHVAVRVAAAVIRDVSVARARIVDAYGKKKAQSKRNDELERNEQTHQS